MSGIDIAVCTFRRPHLAATLHSLAQLELPPDCTVRIIVADNDETPSARALVEKTAAATGLAITYLHAPARNISVARNACLAAATAPLLAFVDDDELATPGWLAALVAELEKTGADAVLGPALAQYPAACPAWIRRGDYHSNRPVRVAGEIRTGYSSNVLLRRTNPAFADLRFREELGRSGGEDTVFFAAAYQAGARIAYAPTAVVTEDIPPGRASFRWLFIRRFRAGQTHALLAGSRLVLFAKATGKAFFCMAMALLIVIRPNRTRYWLLRGALHLGVVARLLGLGEIELYG